MTGVVRSGAVLDEVTDQSGSVVLVELESNTKVARVSPIGSAVLVLTRDGMSVTELVAHLSERFGPPTGDAEAMVRQVVDEIVENGLARWVGPADASS